MAIWLSWKISFAEERQVLFIENTLTLNAPSTTKEEALTQLGKAIQKAKKMDTKK